MSGSSAYVNLLGDAVRKIAPRPRHPTRSSVIQAACRRIQDLRIGSTTERLPEEESTVALYPAGFLGA
jgi:hypothetical protein